MSQNQQSFKEELKLFCQVEDVWEINFEKEGLICNESKKIDISNDGNYLAIALIEKNALCYLFSIPKKSLIQRLSPIELNNKFHKFGVKVNFSQSSQYVLMTLFKEIIWYDVRNLVLAPKDIKLDQYIINIHTDSNHKLIVVNQDHSISVYDLRNADLINQIDFSKHSVISLYHVYISPFQINSITINKNSTSCLINSQNGKIIRQFRKYTGKIEELFYLVNFSYQTTETRNSCFVKLYSFPFNKLIRKIRIPKRVTQSRGYAKFFKTKFELIITIEIHDRWADDVQILEIRCFSLEQRSLSSIPEYNDIYFTQYNYYQVQGNKKDLSILRLRKSI